jgi:phytoene desaturase
MKTVAIIGAGIGGLATAIRLVAKGYLVDVFEKESYPGGKLAELRVGGFRFDLGPSLFTHPERVDDLFRLLGEDSADYFQYNRLSTLCRYFWPDGTQLNAPANPKEFAYESRRALNVDTASISEYLLAAGKLYTLASPVFFDQPFPSVKALMSPAGRLLIKNFISLDPLFSLHQRSMLAFKDPKMAQLFDRYAAIFGSNPFRAPAALKIAAHLQHHSGLFFPEDGMYSIARQLADLALRHGVRFHYNSLIQRVNRNIEGNHITGVRLLGRNLDYDLVVSDIDINSFYRHGMVDYRSPLPGRLQRAETSAIIFYWGISGVHVGLDLHNVLFAANPEEEYRYLYKLKKICPDPTLDLYISSKAVPKDAPAGYENWIIMVNTPADIGQNWDQGITRLREIVLKKINDLLGIDLNGKIVFEHIDSPPTIARRTGSWRGALYGSTYNSRISAFIRHPNRRSKINGLYFTGGSVHPGGGIPLCLASAKIVADLIEEKEG